MLSDVTYILNFNVYMENELKFVYIPFNIYIYIYEYIYINYSSFLFRLIYI